MVEIIKKKRGRKPKNLNIIKEIPVNEESINTEDEKIILHLPLTMNEIHNNDDLNIFIKPEEKKKEEILEKSDSVETINVTSQKIITNPTNNINKIITHVLNFNKNTKCWWCKYIFDNPALQLPEDYYNETFFCIGHFCSYNCMKSYNLDLNDSLTYKRESLINLLYYLTYSEYKQINVSPHWITLIDFGGTLTIEKFRENLIVNTKEYLVLHPPLISRQMQIEESYKLNKLKEVPIDKINKLYSEIDSEYTIKRKKPINSSAMNLESTMGLIKKKVK
jgi:hypothetical protein